MCKCCIGALPPFVIFKRKTMNQELANGEHSMVFLEWLDYRAALQRMVSPSLSCLFTQYTNGWALNPLLPKDNSNGCCMQSWPLHITTPHNSLIQPLDKGYFALLKITVNMWCNIWHCGVSTTPYLVCLLLSQCHILHQWCDIHTSFLQWWSGVKYVNGLS